MKGRGGSCALQAAGVGDLKAREGRKKAAWLLPPLLVLYLYLAACCMNLLSLILRQTPAFLLIFSTLALLIHPDSLARPGEKILKGYFVLMCTDEAMFHISHINITHEFLRGDS